MKEQLLYFKRSDLEKHIEKLRKEKSKPTVLRVLISAKIELLQSLLSTGKDCEELWIKGWDRKTDYTTFIKSKEEK